MDRKNHDDEEGDKQKGPPSRQWLYDRIDGESKHRGQTSRPPCPPCWVPPPVRYCPSIIEENPACKLWGKVGCIDVENERGRLWIMRIGLISNAIAFCLTLYACTAIRDGIGAIQSASFSSCVIQEVSGPFNVDFATLDVGLRSVVIDLVVTDTIKVDGMDESSTQAMISFSEFCTLGKEDSWGVEDFVKGDECTQCNEVTSSMVLSVIISTITFLPTFFTDITRMYSNYDVNCQKFWATGFACITLVLSLSTLLQYNLACFESFYEGEISYSANLTALDPGGADDNEEEEVAYILSMSWKAGPGLICLYIGTLLKLVDIVCHMMVPTPTITRNREEQTEYEELRRKEKADDEEK